MVLIIAVVKSKHTAWEYDFATGATGLYKHFNPTSPGQFNTFSTWGGGGGNSPPLCKFASVNSN